MAARGQATVTTAPEAGELARWRIVDDPGAIPASVPATVTLTEFSTGAAFRFQRRG